MSAWGNAPGIESERKKAIAIPNLLRARIAANESSAVSSIRTINTAEVAYQTSNPTVGYAAILSPMPPLPPASVKVPPAAPPPPPLSVAGLLANVQAASSAAGPRCPPFGPAWLPASSVPSIVIVELEASTSGRGPKAVSEPVLAMLTPAT